MHFALEENIDINETKKAFTVQMSYFNVLKYSMH